MNKVMIIGNLTRDPELSTTNSGISLCRFSVAVSRKFANADGERETDFLNVIVWRGLAENCHKYLKKGSKVCVCGSIQTRNFEAQDGTKRYITEIVADDVEFLNRSGSGDEGAIVKDNDAPASQSTPVTKLEPIDDDDLPF